jgi:hypothetical protein
MAERTGNPLVDDLREDALPTEQIGRSPQAGPNPA